MKITRVDLVLPSQRCGNLGYLGIKGRDPHAPQRHEVPFDGCTAPPSRFPLPVGASIEYCRICRAKKHDAAGSALWDARQQPLMPG